MGTYKEIRDWVKDNHGFVPRTCWIAHCKELAGVPVRAAPNRVGPDRVVPCPCARREAITDALRHFKVIPELSGLKRGAKKFDIGAIGQ